ncbi:YqgE/AlgH family protein [Anianabacter salinae]|uniref:YqgE/AlgH family protein n=1 Tax=Anianabacter salinae TaxID=2851023 RepID=UPI00225DD372|nr:YqgE/AlgH family protein [Anianabacter salinae]MBV0913199.1 YqgE/AlgH family protein [Anianabacter salinae]
MSQPHSTDQLAGKLLIAMPGMADPRFETGLVFLCDHSDSGSMGLIVNKPTDGVAMDDLLMQLEIDGGIGSAGIGVHFGGPVEHGRGFVLHSSDYGANSSTLRIGDGFGMTATLDILEDIAGGRGPDRVLLALGYAGWAPGQLEGEIRANGWLTCDATPELVFDTPDAQKWQSALKGLGVEALGLSSVAGRA